MASLAVGLVFGLAPAWQTTGCQSMQAIGSDSRTTARGGRFRSVLVVVEVAAAVLVLCGAGLLLRTLISLQSVDPGSRAQDALTMTLNLPFRMADADAIPTPGGGAAVLRASREGSGADSGRAERRVGGALPLDGMWWGRASTSRATRRGRDQAGKFASYHMISPTYFETLDIPIVSGRTSLPTDSADASRCAS